nr:MAG TPA: hypothetical protein [Microviridae sp.]
MEKKTWNVRDQTDASLMEKLMETYKAIDAGYRMVRKAANIEDAQYYLDIVYRKKAFASNIEVELLRREINRGKEE